MAPQRLRPSKTAVYVPIRVNSLLKTNGLTTFVRVFSYYLPTVIDER